MVNNLNLLLKKIANVFAQAKEDVDRGWYFTAKVDLDKAASTLDTLITKDTPDGVKILLRSKVETIRSFATEAEKCDDLVSSLLYTLEEAARVTEEESKHEHHN